MSLQSPTPEPTPTDQAKDFLARLYLIRSAIAIMEQMTTDLNISWATGKLSRAGFKTYKDALVFQLNELTNPDLDLEVMQQMVKDTQLMHDKFLRHLEGASS